MFRSVIVPAILTLSFGIFATGCGEDSSTKLGMVSGGTGGTYYPTSVAIDSVTEKSFPDIKIDVATSGGSVDNANQLRNGNAELALMQSDIASYAHHGKLMFEDKGNSNLLAVASLYPEHIQVFATKSSGIKTIADLKGKRVAIGDIGSGSEANALQILEAYGMTPEDFSKIERLGSSDARDYMQDGRIDAAFFTFAVGSGALKELAERADITIVPIDGDEREALLKKYQFYQTGVVPAGSYKGVDADVQTMKMTAVLVADASVKPEVVKSILESMFKNIEDIHNVKPVLKNFTLQDAPKVPIPLHPGAKSYYDENK